MNIEKLLTGWHFSGDGIEQDVTLPHDFMLGTPRTPDSPTGPNYGYFQPCKGTYTRRIVKPPPSIISLGSTVLWASATCI